MEKKIKILFILLIASLFFITMIIPIKAIKNGYYLAGAHEVDTKIFFDDFYYPSASSFTPDTEYYIWFKDSKFMYYSQKCFINNNFACSFKKIKIDLLEKQFPAYKLPNSFMVYHGRIKEIVEKNQERYDSKKCRLYGGSYEERHEFNGNEIVINVLVGYTCKQNEDGKIKRVNNTHVLHLSVKDFSVLESKSN